VDRKKDKRDGDDEMNLHLPRDSQWTVRLSVAKASEHAAGSGLTADTGSRLYRSIAYTAIAERQHLSTVTLEAKQESRAQRAESIGAGIARAEDPWSRDRRLLFPMSVTLIAYLACAL
jgi:hypothetical protein